MKRVWHPLLLLLLGAALLVACGSDPAPGPIDFTVIAPEEVPGPVRDILEKRHTDQHGEDTGWIGHGGDAYAYIGTEEQVRTEVLAVTLDGESMIFEVAYRFQPIDDPAQATPLVLIRFPNPGNRLVSFVREDGGHEDP